ncbi:hypothetical protein [Xanthomarina sp. F2636L]|uniref:hypothetical protein n=1 Tax=Xanthomarina sp. F2636L TaxID=2996018 RepID=UPI00225E1C86|nr:hypothetical protein [Xanthomarina sp. F2636L]MCX7551014.1 hypothetical protein [Xanthomarina sp. F2636L]
MKQFFLLVIIVTSFSISAQTDSLQFPQDFYGIYKGDLNIVNSKGKQTIQMEFHLNKTDSIGKYQYMLVYIMKGERQERKYNLIEKDASKGEYTVDENNGILLDAKLIDNTIYSMFEVQDNILTTTERFYKDAMDFEITVTNKTHKVTTGTEGVDATEVVSYPIFAIQKAHLIKQK